DLVRGAAPETWLAGSSATVTCEGWLVSGLLTASGANGQVSESSVAGRQVLDGSVSSSGCFLVWIALPFMRDSLRGVLQMLQRNRRTVCPGKHRGRVLPGLRSV